MSNFRKTHSEGCYRTSIVCVMIEKAKISRFSYTEMVIDDKTIKYFVEEDGERISNLRFVELLKNDREFYDFIKSIFISNPFEAVFWENPPLSKSNLAECYQFALVKSARLHLKPANPKPYQEYFSGNGTERAVAFPNLGKTTTLICPTPAVGDNKFHNHLANFVKNVEPIKVHAFWKKVGEELGNSISEKPIYLSTHGLGVPWLHVRLAWKPKYYRFEEYKKWLDN